MKKIKQLLNSSKGFLYSLVRKTKPNSIEDLHLQIDNLQHSKILDSHLSKMLKGVLSINNLRARDLMVPRAHIDYFEIDDDLDHILTNVLAHGHSRFPVLSEDQESIGLLFAKDLLKYLTEREVQEARELHELLNHEYIVEGADYNTQLQSPTHSADIEALTQVQLPDQNHIIDNNGFNLRNIIKPVSIIPESKRVTTLLQEFQSNHTHLALVVNEFGEISGLITIEDILEEIVGDISDEFDVNEQSIRQISKTTFEVMATTYLEDFNEKFNIDLESEEFDTIGGYIVNLLGKVPSKNEVVELDNGRLILRVILVEENRKIVKFRVRCNNLKTLDPKTVDGSVIDLNETEHFAEQMHEAGEVVNQQLELDTTQESNQESEQTESSNYTPRIAKKIKEIVHNVNAVIDEKASQLCREHNNKSEQDDHMDNQNLTNNQGLINDQDFTNNKEQVSGQSQNHNNDQNNKHHHEQSENQNINHSQKHYSNSHDESSKQQASTQQSADNPKQNYQQTINQDLNHQTQNPNSTQTSSSSTSELLKTSEIKLDQFVEDELETVTDISYTNVTINASNLNSDAQLTELDHQDQLASVTNSTLNSKPIQGEQNGLFKSIPRTTKTSTRTSGSENCESEKLSNSNSGRTERETSSSERREEPNSGSDQQSRSISSERQSSGSERRSDRSEQISNQRSEKQTWFLNKTESKSDFDTTDKTQTSVKDHTAEYYDDEDLVVLDKNLQPVEPGVNRAEETAEQTVQNVLAEINPQDEAEQTNPSLNSSASNSSASNSSALITKAQANSTQTNNSVPAPTKKTKSKTKKRKTSEGKA